MLEPITWDTDHPRTHYQAHRPCWNPLQGTPTMLDPIQATPTPTCLKKCPIWQHRKVGVVGVVGVVGRL